MLNLNKKYIDLVNTKENELKDIFNKIDELSYKNSERY